MKIIELFEEEVRLLFISKKPYIKLRLQILNIKTQNIHYKIRVKDSLAKKYVKNCLKESTEFLPLNVYHQIESLKHFMAEVQES